MCFPLPPLLNLVAANIWYLFVLWADWPLLTVIELETQSVVCLFSKIGLAPLCPNPSQFMWVDQTSVLDTFLFQLLSLCVWLKLFVSQWKLMLASCSSAKCSVLKSARFTYPLGIWIKFIIPSRVMKYPMVHLKGHLTGHVTSHLIGNIDPKTTFKCLIS